MPCSATTCSFDPTEVDCATACARVIAVCDGECGEVFCDSVITDEVCLTTCELEKTFSCGNATFGCYTFNDSCDSIAMCLALHQLERPGQGWEAPAAQRCEMTPEATQLPVYSRRGLRLCEACFSGLRHSLKKQAFTNKHGNLPASPCSPLVTPYHLISHRRVNVRSTSRAQRRPSDVTRRGVRLRSTIDAQALPRCRGSTPTSTASAAFVKLAIREGVGDRSSYYGLNVELRDAIRQVSRAVEAFGWAAVIVRHQRGQQPHLPPRHLTPSRRPKPRHEGAQACCGAPCRHVGVL